MSLLLITDAQPLNAGALVIWSTLAFYSILTLLGVLFETITRRQKTQGKVIDNKIVPVIRRQTLPGKNEVYNKDEDSEYSEYIYYCAVIEFIDNHGVSRQFTSTDRKRDPCTIGSFLHISHPTAYPDRAKEDISPIGRVILTGMAIAGAYYGTIYGIIPLLHQPYPLK